MNLVKIRRRGQAGVDTILKTHNSVENGYLQICATKKCLNNPPPQQKSAGSILFNKIACPKKKLKKVKVVLGTFLSKKFVDV